MNKDQFKADYEEAVRSIYPNAVLVRKHNSYTYKVRKSRELGNELLKIFMTILGYFVINLFGVSLLTDLMKVFLSVLFIIFIIDWLANPKVLVKLKGSELNHIKNLYLAEKEKNKVGIQTQNIDTLLKLKQLLDQGVITKEEFETKKKEIFDKL